MNPNRNNIPEMGDQQLMAQAKVDFAELPEEMRQNYLYCVWKREPRPSGKPAKVPYNPRTGMRADCSDPSTFGTLADVQNYAERGYDGVGVLVTFLAGDTRMIAVNIDNCIDDNGNYSQTAIDIIQILGSYTEISPSGHGIRILVTVHSSFTYDSNRYYINNQKIGLEIYDPAYTKKYVSVTGHTLTPGIGLEQREKELMAVLEKYMVRKDQLPPQTAAQAPHTVS